MVTGVEMDHVGGAVAGQPGSGGGQDDRGLAEGQAWTIDEAIAAGLASQQDDEL